MASRGHSQETTGSDAEIDRMFRDAHQGGTLPVTLQTPFVFNPEGQSKKWNLPICHHFTEDEVYWSGHSNTSSELTPNGTVDIRKEPGYKTYPAINGFIWPIFKEVAQSRSRHLSRSFSARKHGKDLRLGLGSKQRPSNEFCFLHDEERPWDHKLNLWGNDEAFKFSSFMKGIHGAVEGDVDPRVQVRRILNSECPIFCSQQQKVGGEVRGLFAAERIPAYTVLGMYGGEVKEEENGRSAQGSEKSGRYTIDLPPFFGSEGKTTHYLDGERFYNEMAFINDPHNTGCSANAEFIGCHVNAWPVVVVVATADIEQDAQVYVDYGFDEEDWAEGSMAMSSPGSEIY